MDSEKMEGYQEKVLNININKINGSWLNIIRMLKYK